MEEQRRAEGMVGGERGAAATGCGASEPHTSAKTGGKEKRKKKHLEGKTLAGGGKKK